MTDFEVGQQVTLDPNETFLSMDGWGSYKFTEPLRITRVFRDCVLVRGIPEGYATERSTRVSKDDVRPLNGPAPRKLGEVPSEQGTITPDHPGIQWLWEDAAALARRRGHCSAYDDMAEVLGIPGRERDFTISTEINGLKVKTTVKARSRTEAERLVKTTLGT